MNHVIFEIYIAQQSMMMIMRIILIINLKFLTQNLMKWTTMPTCLKKEMNRSMVWAMKIENLNHSSTYKLFLVYFEPSIPYIDLNKLLQSVHFVATWCINETIQNIFLLVSWHFCFFLFIGIWIARYVFKLIGFLDKSLVCLDRGAERGRKRECAFSLCGLCFLLLLFDRHLSWRFPSYGSMFLVTGLFTYCFTCCRQAFRRCYFLGYMQFLFPTPHCTHCKSVIQSRG